MAKNNSGASNPYVNDSPAQLDVVKEIIERKLQKNQNLKTACLDIWDRVCKHGFPTPKKCAVAFQLEGIKSGKSYSAHSAVRWMEAFSTI